MNILITGGSGFFGQAFVRTLLARKLSERICIYSRSEFTQAQMRQSLNDDPRLRWFIGDVRDQDRLRRAMTDIDVVVHAAALKRIEVAEYNVLECVATNVNGTSNVVKACIDARVKKAVLLSTDKACEPTNAYGMSKALAERIFLSAAHYAGEKGPRFAVTRYGNVAGSTGSVIPFWRSLLQNQTEVPVTHPLATRFWMTAQEAVDLVLTTIDTLKGGELVIPTLPAYDLETLMGALGTKPAVPFVGLRPGEKMHESMEPGKSSEHARRMTLKELREALANL